MSDLALVTGATGWLGSSLVAALARDGRPVRAFVHNAEDDKAIRDLPGVEVVRGDIRESADVDRFVDGAQGATLFHTAGIIHPKRVSEFYEINVDGTTRALAAAARAGVRRAVVVSSNSPIGVSYSNKVIFDESSPYRPYMNYGRSKMKMELAVREFERRGLIETVIIRPPWFYGPNQPPRQTLFFKLIRDGKFPMVGDGTNLRSMSYIENLVQGLLLAESVPAARGQTYWIADERPYSMNEIVGTVRALMRDEFNEKVAESTTRLPWIAGEVATYADAAIQRTGRYEQRVHVLSEMNKTIACSIDKAKRELGYEPRVALEEGMRRSLRWLKGRERLSTGGLQSER